MFYVFLGLILAIFIFGIISRSFGDPYRDIFFVMGKPGSGKSTFFVHKMLYYQKLNKKILKKGGTPWSIYSDSPVNLPGIRLFNPLDLAKCFPEEKSVMFIDEISLVWDSRNFSKFDSGVSEFMKLHRHAECIIFCASQNFDCDKRIRDLCTHFLIVSNISGLFCLVRPVITIFPIFTEPDSTSGSQITSGYQYSKFWNWRLFFMLKTHKYFNTKSLPSRPDLPYKTVPCPFLQDFKFDKTKISENFINLSPL